MNKNSVHGLILAGGQSRRLNGIDKGLLDVQGKALVEHVAGNLKNQTDGISIVANRSLSAYQQYAPKVLPDTITGFAGPLAGLATFAELAESSWVAIVACDLIFLPEDWVDRLLTEALNRNQNVVCAIDKISGKRALCAVARRDCLASATTLLCSGQPRWMDWLAYNRAGTEPLETTKLFNINSLEDAKEAEILLKIRSLSH